VTIAAYEELGCKSHESPTQFEDATALFSARAAQRTSSVKSSVGSAKGNKRKGKMRGHSMDGGMTDVELKEYAKWYWGVCGALEDSNYACSDAGTCHNTALVATLDALLISIGAAESKMSKMNLCYALSSLVAIPCLHWKDSRNDDEVTRKLPDSQSFDLLVRHALGEKQPQPAQADADAVAVVDVEAALLTGEHIRTELLATGLSREVAEFAQSDILKQQATTLAIALEDMQRGHTQPTAWPTALVSPLAEIGLSGVDALRCTNLLVVEMVLAHCEERFKEGQRVRAYVKGTCKEAEIERTARELARVLSHLERTRHLFLLEEEATKDGGSAVAEMDDEGGMHTKAGGRFAGVVGGAMGTSPSSPLGQLPRGVRSSAAMSPMLATNPLMGFGGGGGLPGVPQMPEGWSEKVDPHSECTYFWGATTKQTCWLPPAAGQGHPVYGITSAWHEKQDMLSGKKYYAHKLTGRASWDPPPAPPTSDPPKEEDVKRIIADAVRQQAGGVGVGKGAAAAGARKSVVHDTEEHKNRPDGKGVKIKQSLLGKLRALSGNAHEFPKKMKRDSSLRTTTGKLLAVHRPSSAGGGSVAQLMTSGGVGGSRRDSHNPLHGPAQHDELPGKEMGNPLHQTPSLPTRKSSTSTIQPGIMRVRQGVAHI
jgi:hypothetical protein